MQHSRLPFHQNNNLYLLLFPYVNECQNVKGCWLLPSPIHQPSLKNTECFHSPSVLKWWMFHVPCLFAHLTFIIFIVSQVFTCFNIISWLLKIVTPNDSGSKNCLTPAKNVMKMCQIWWSHSWDNKVKINDTMFYCGI